MKFFEERLHLGSDSIFQIDALENLRVQLDVLLPSILSAVQMHDAGWERTMQTITASNHRLKITPSALRARFFIMFSTGEFEVRNEHDPRPSIDKQIEVSVLACGGRYWVLAGEEGELASLGWEEVGGGFADLHSSLSEEISSALDLLEDDIPQDYKGTIFKSAQRLSVVDMEKTIFTEGVISFKAEGGNVEGFTEGVL